ncbi:MAG TPA: hypothetical protein VGW12_00755 [Pyrinomonadaceae bacterium]|nr:hypothetical protein [Pyrinomonadaceae bacterium]
MRARLFPAVICAVTLFSIASFAQTPEARRGESSPQAQERAPNVPPNVNSIDTVANEIGLLRKSLQTLNSRLREVSDKYLAPDSTRSGQPDDKQTRISLNLELLSRAEQRAEVMRKQFLELIEKETSFKTRLVQIEEDMRPDSVERAISLIGTTRTSELRDVRRRVLENERKGVESLLNQTSQSRARLEDDVKQADVLVLKLRQRVLPLIEKEIEKINPN